MNTKLFATVLSAVVLIISGCGLTGNWESYSFSPEIARQDFNFLGASGYGGDFTGTTIQLRDDKTYRAEVSVGDKIEIRRGEWEKGKERITFVNSSGQAHTYYYMLESDKLHLKETIQGTEVVLTLKRNK